MANYLFEFTVKGRGSFPVDMLRYDFCSPASERDSGEIARSFAIRQANETFEVKLKAVKTTKSWYPKDGRWKSFGYSVLNCDCRKV